MPKELRILKTWYRWDCPLWMLKAVLKKMQEELSFNRNMQRLDLGWDDQREMPNGKDLMCTNRNLQEMKFRLFVVLLKGGHFLTQENRGIYLQNA